MYLLALSLFSSVVGPSFSLLSVALSAHFPPSADDPQTPDTYIGSSTGTTLHRSAKAGRSIHSPSLPFQGQAR